MGLPQALGRLLRFRRALGMMTGRELRSRVSGTLLGPLWLLLQPMFMLTIYTLVFGFLLKVRFRADAGTLSFAQYLMAGLVPFLAFQEAVQGATGALLRNRNLVQRSVFPAELLPAIPAAVSVVTEALGMLVLIAAVWLIEGRVSWLLWLLPLLMATRLLLTLGVSWLVAVLAVFFRDLGQLVGMLLTMTFFATPILYPAELVPEHWRWLHTVNPFYHLVEAYRGVILDGAWPAPGLWVSLGVALAAALFGLTIFNRLQWRAKDLL